MKLVGMVRAQTEYSLVSISEPEMKIVTHGKPYKFVLLNGPKILSRRSVPSKKCIFEAR